MHTNLEALQGIQTALVTDALRRLGYKGWMRETHSLKSGHTILGRARTVQYAPTRSGKAKSSIYSIISDTNLVGDVVVIDALATEAWVLGENIALTAQCQGLKGIVVNGGVRDSRQIMDLGFPVFCRSIAVCPPIGLELVGYNVPINCGGTQVNPGDIVVGDYDGVVVFPEQILDDVITQIADLMKLENKQRDLITAGRPVWEILDVVKQKKNRL